MGPQASHVRDRFPVHLVAVAFLLTGALLALMLQMTYGTQRSLRVMHEQQLRIMELRGVIIHLDEVLTMSARMSASTGEPRWKARYEEFVPQLDEAIKEVIQLAGSDAFSGEAATQTDIANKLLIEMEMEAFDRVSVGRLDLAQEILFSQSYESQKKVYADGMAQVANHLKVSLLRTIEGQRRRLLTHLVITAALVLILGVAWIGVMHGVHDWQAALVEQSRQLTSQAHELALANLTLDQRVAERTKQLEASRVAALNLMQDANEAREAAEEANRDLQQAQAQLVQAAKMESIGRLTSGIAHDFNNYLSVIHGFAELAQMQHKDDPKLLGQIQEILHASESGTALIQQLMAFSRQRPVESKVFSMTEGVKRIRSLLQQLVGEQVKVVIELPPTSLLIRLDPTGLEQMLMNLASNARDAMKREGTLTISVVRIHPDENFRIVRPWANASEYVKLSVRDTGPGMDPGVAERIFEPFYTTKQLGQGTGLGLAVVYGLVKQYDGNVEVDTQIGKGTAFHLYFPHQVTTEEREADALAQPAPATATPAPGSRARKERVLVVDDEPGSRQLCQQILQETYEVTTAASGREALEMLRQGAPDLLLTDIQMPDMDGVTLIEQAGKLHPGLKVAVMSAYMTKEREDQLRSLPVRCEIISKPLAVTSLKELVSRSLQG